jgi:hypothetical protein
MLASHPLSLTPTQHIVDRDVDDLIINPQGSRSFTEIAVLPKNGVDGSAVD